MGLSHQELLKCCISILDGFNDDVYAIENRVEEFFSAYEVMCQFITNFAERQFRKCSYFADMLKWQVLELF